MRGLEESFICGLLHDFGKFLLLNHDKEGYSELLGIDNEFEMLQAEVKHYGYNHSEVGSLVARRWNLPDEVCYSILNHHNPSQSEHPKIVEHIIDVADILANVNGYGLRIEEVSKLMSSESVMKLGLNEKFLENVWERTKGNIAEIIRTFA
jgi:HD-like signal output (HDOD) protein